MSITFHQLSEALSKQVGPIADISVEYDNDSNVYIVSEDNAELGLEGMVIIDETIDRLVDAGYSVITEISQGMRTRYVDKARGDLDAKKFWHDENHHVKLKASLPSNDPVLKDHDKRANDIRKRKVGIQKSGFKSAGIEVNEETREYTIDAGVSHPLSKGLEQSFRKTVEAESEEHAVDQVKNHIKSRGWRCHSARCLKEDTTISEVSKELLGRYVKKASDSLSDSAEDQGYYSRRDSNLSTNTQNIQQLKHKLARQTVGKRLKGIDKAVDKIVKEDTLSQRKADIRSSRGGMIHKARIQIGKVIDASKNIKPDVDLGDLNPYNNELKKDKKLTESIDKMEMHEKYAEHMDGIATMHRKLGELLDSNRHDPNINWGHVRSASALHKNLKDAHWLGDHGNESQ